MRFSPDRVDPTDPVPDPTSWPSELAGEHRTCVPLEEFDNGDVANAPEQDADLPWNRSGPGGAR